MKNSTRSLMVLTATFLLASVLFTACKSKKMVTPPPPPVEAAPVAPPPPPAPAPEPDSDTDGVVDSKDNCPNQAGPASNNGCPEPPKINFTTQTILFEFNSAVLKTSSYPVLDEISKVMKQFPEEQFNLDGHSSLEGTEARNMTLSVDRANAVKNYLVTSGVNTNNLTTQGFGETMPVNSNETETERQANRRVEIKKK